ncbi:C-factor-like isoform X1 [Cyprinus carpio]|uniref:C-factor-like isoform X1 n=4 Tax=Cyprinus carpio TaxID=7962 RepID=A0A8C2ALH6_CYPCA|nr:C-factor-like isoform X1 [Cyprinus carpio]
MYMPSTVDGVKVTDKLIMASRICDSVLVTGSNRGIGLELVRQLADSPLPPVQIFAGCRDPNGPRSQDLQELAQKHHDVITVVQLDTTSPTSIAEASKLVEAKLKGKGLNLIINNAGVNIPGSLVETGKQEMVDVFTTNVVGPMLIAKDFHPLLCKAAAQFPHQTSMSCSRSAIINVSTLLSSIKRCPENFSVSPMYPYRVSKAALNMLTCCLAEDFRKDGILVMSLHPGWVQTEMGGPEAPLTTLESISSMLKVITSLTEKESGTLLDWEGKNIPW